MKSVIRAFVLATVIAAPLTSFAQSTQPLTRAEVRAQLIQIEQAGYRPGDGDNTTYPAQIQAAEARVAAQNAAAANSGYGVATNGSSQSGARANGAAQPSASSIFDHH
jgi:hypothetical protein